MKFIIYFNLNYVDYESFQFLSMVIEGSQVDFHSTLVFDIEKNINYYKHAYFIRYFIDDGDDPCSSNPCLNNGTCLVVAEDSYVCYCQKNHHGMLT